MLDRAEGSLLSLLLLRPDLVDRARVRLTPELLTTTPARELWKALESNVGPEGQFDRKQFLEGLDPTLEAVARTLYARNDPVPQDESALFQAVDQSVLTLVRNQLSETLDFKRAELAEAEAGDDAQAVDRLTSDVRELQHRRLQLDREHAGTSLLANRRIQSTPSVPTPAGGPA
jgi:hypothetical protein